MIYLDYAATSPVDPLVLEAMLPYFSETFANPSSLHYYGQQARRGLETAREQVATAIKAKAKELIFTSGATEAINQALRMFSAGHPGGHIVTSLLEHKAVLASCEWLEQQGTEVTYLAPNADGLISPEQVQAALKPNTFLVALMLVNNETGVRTDIGAISKLVHTQGAFLFCDAVQAFAYEAVDVEGLGVDMLALSGHKVYGPKGVGVLYLREGLELSPFMLGGEQERGYRAGTHNLASIVGMGKAAELATERFQDDSRKLYALKEGFERQLLELDGVSINGHNVPRSAKHSSVRVAGVDGEALLLNLDTLGVAASAGSACAAGSLEPSHVLTAMGLSYEEAKASIRFSLGREISKNTLEQTVELFKQAVERCRVYA
jgi:cysteine desulfurase